MGKEVQVIEVKCPKCHRTQIITIPKEEIPKCPDCKIQMIISEVLDEGKSY
jgi:phage FluMu protein Com